MNFAWNARLPLSIQESFTCRKSTTWEQRLYFPSEGRRAEDFFALKNPTASAGFEPANLGTVLLPQSHDNRHHVSWAKCPSSILAVTGWHPTHILATHMKDRSDTGNSNALIAEAHWSMRSLPTCHMSLGSLTAGMPEAKDFVGSLVPYHFWMFQVFCNAVCCCVNSCQCV